VSALLTLALAILPASSC